MNASLYPTVPYDPEKDFVPIVEIATGALALVVHPTLGVSTLAELIALARSKPARSTMRLPPRHTATSRHGAVQAHGADQPDAQFLIQDRPAR
jgi:tripartite-type tricarboxylate transporter receptor subunit TctC